MIGDTVTVTIDRPLGSYHLEHPDLYYPINYGYIDGTMAPDGEAEDAYVLGVYQPIKIFTGKVIARIHRKNDVEDKWVVAPDGYSFAVEEIEEAIRFQERFFHSEVVLE